MRIASFTVAGVATYGVVDPTGGYRPVSGAFLKQHPDLKSVLQAQALDAMATDAARSQPLAASQVALLPVVPNPGKLICVGLNYKSHVAETKRADSDYPSLFLRFNDSLAAHGDEVLRPVFSERFDWEGELAFVIGKGGRHISKDNAFDHIAGYACFNDVSVRDWQKHTHQFTPGKNFPGTAPFGPVLVTRDEVPDVTRLNLETRVNGNVVQRAPIADLTCATTTCAPCSANSARCRSRRSNRSTRPWKTRAAPRWPPPVCRPTAWSSSVPPTCATWARNTP